MVKEQKGLSTILLLGGAGVAAYFIWKYFKEEPAKEGFIRVSSPMPNEATAGSTVSITVIGKNTTAESHLCFIQIIDQETTELLAPQQSAQVGAGLSKQFTFEFTMPNRLLRLEIQTGRIINNEEIIDDKFPKTIALTPGVAGADIRDLKIMVS